MNISQNLIAFDLIVWLVHFTKVGSYQKLISQGQPCHRSWHSDVDSCSIVRMTTTVVLALDAAPSHGVDQGDEDPLGERLPLSLQKLKQVLGVPWRWVVVPHSAVQFIPEILNRIEVRAAS